MIVKEAEFQVVDFSGRLMLNGKIETGMDNFFLDVSSLPGGIYLMIVRINDCLLSGKFIKAN